MLLLTLLACKVAPEVPLTECALDALDPGALRADGTVLRDQHDRRALLRGVNAGGRSKFAPYSPFDYDAADPGGYDAALAEYLDNAQGWGVTTLRVPFSWAAVEPVEGDEDEEFLARYVALLEGAGARGMWTIVDFHQDVYAESFCGDGFPAWTLEDPGEPRHDCPDWFFYYATDEDVRAAFDAFWADEGGIQGKFQAMWGRMAARTADIPGVVGFEIINEPGWGSADPTEWEAEVLTPFTSEMVAVLQEAAPDKLVFFDTTGLNSVAVSIAMERPAGDGLVFAPHYYDTAVFAGGDLAEADPAAGLDLWADVGEDWDVPVLVGEFGAPASAEGAEEYLEAQYAILDERRLHATQWEYSISHELWNEEELSVMTGSLVDGTAAEQPGLLRPLVRPYPRAIAGEEPEWTYDPETDTLTLRYLPHPSGITEIVLPAAAHGDSVAVTGAGGCYDLEADRLLVRSADGATRVELTVQPAQ